MALFEERPGIDVDDLVQALEEWSTEGGFTPLEWSEEG